MKRILFIFCVIIFSCNTTENIENSSETDISNTFLEKVEPTNWWVKMKNPNLQLLVHHPDISSYKPEINYTGVSVKESTRSTKSNNYLFIDLEITENTKAGKFDILFKKENSKTLTHTYELKLREKPTRQNTD